MTLRQTRRAVQSGAWVLDSGGEITASTVFQKRRLTEAASAARMYLNGEMPVGDLAQFLGTDGKPVTAERAAQVVRLGITYLLRSGSLRRSE